MKQTTEMDLASSPGEVGQHFDEDMINFPDPEQSTNTDGLIFKGEDKKDGNVVDQHFCDFSNIDGQRFSIVKSVQKSPTLKFFEAMAAMVESAKLPKNVQDNLEL